MASMTLALTAFFLAAATEIQAAPAEPPLTKVEARAPAAPKTETKTPIGIGALVKVGVLGPTNRMNTTVTLGLEARERFPFLGRVLGIAFEFAYFQPNISGSGSDPSVSGSYSYKVSARALELAGDVLVFLPLHLPIDIYGGVGYGMFLYRTEANAFGAKSAEIQGRHGLRLRAGVDWHFWGPLYAGAEIMYHYSAFEFLITGTTNAGAVSGNLHFGFEI
jgi:hypothetical protein